MQTNVKIIKIFKPQTTEQSFSIFTLKFPENVVPEVGMKLYKNDYTYVISGIVFNRHNDSNIWDCKVEISPVEN